MFSGLQPKPKAKQPAQAKIEPIIPNAGRKGDTRGIFKDASLLSGPMYRSQNINTKLGAG